MSRAWFNQTRLIDRQFNHPLSASIKLQTIGSARLRLRANDYTALQLILFSCNFDTAVDLSAHFLAYSPENHEWRVHSRFSQRGLDVGLFLTAALDLGFQEYIAIDLDPSARS